MEKEILVSTRSRNMMLDHAAIVKRLDRVLFFKVTWSRQVAATGASSSSHGHLLILDTPAVITLMLV
jgi:hypothetical protein